MTQQLIALIAYNHCHKMKLDLKASGEVNKVKLTSFQQFERDLHSTVYTDQCNCIIFLELEIPIQAGQRNAEHIFQKWQLRLRINCATVNY